jgi:hypothetical protein
MYAYAIGRDVDDARKLSENLSKLGYERAFAISDLNELPKKVLSLLT